MHNLLRLRSWVIKLIVAIALSKTMLLEVKQIIVPPGQTVILHEISWDAFEAILTDLGESRGSRIAYDQGKLEIMTPLPEHEVNKVYVSNFVEILLEELDIEFCPLGSTTFKNQLIRHEGFP